jgi:two-component system OmpR family sensor kinase
MKSIRRTLSVWLLSSIVLAAVIGAAAIYRNTLAKADQFFDEQLQQAARLLRDQAFEQAVSSELFARASEYDFVVQVWSATGVLAYQSQPHAFLPGLTTLGLATVRTSSEQWRTFGLQSRGYVIQVAQPMSVRREQAAQLALRTLLPFLIVMPLLGLVVLVVVPETLRPLRRITGQVSATRETSLRPIDRNDLPAEVVPLVDAFNDLLRRLSATLEREQAFIADAAHELRTPLTALRLQLSELLAATDVQQREQAEQRLAGGVGRAVRLVEQLLSLARTSSQRQKTLAVVALDDVVREVVAEKVTLADAKRIDLGVVTAEPCRLFGDAFALRALLGNLIDNALHYSPTGTRVDLLVTAENHSATLRVVDMGPGIPESEHPKVFERFYRLRSDEAPGSGLGLAIVKSVAEEHSATVELATGANGRGLTVIVRFPLAAQQPTNAAS